MNTRKLIKAECFDCGQIYLLFWFPKCHVIAVPSLYCSKCLKEMDWHFFDAPLREDGYHLDHDALKKLISEDYLWGIL